MGGKLTREAEVAVREIHNRYDVDLDRLLDKNEFIPLIAELTGKTLVCTRSYLSRVTQYLQSDGEFQQVLKSIDDRSGKVTADGLVDYFAGLGKTPAGLAEFKKALKYVCSLPSCS